MNRKLLLISDLGDETIALRSALRKYFLLSERVLMTDDNEDLSEFPVVVVDFDLKDKDKLEKFRLLYPRAAHPDCARIFLVDRGCRMDSVQAANLRARETLPRPIDARALHRAVCNASPAFTALLREKPSVALETAQDGLQCLEFISAAVQDGVGVSRADVSENAAKICSAVSQGKTLEWLGAVNNHHSYSYRHSLHVAGLMIAFADHLKFKESDKARMVVGALMHDLGKSKLPLRLLDKEGPLTPEEMTIFRSHPILGFDILKNDGQWDQLTIDLVYQHHEFLNGTGYPNGLREDRIVDPVRMLTIVDIFSALVDKRSYKEPMTPTQAMQTLYAMNGKLDMALVHAFEPVGVRLIGGLKELELAA